MIFPKKCLGCLPILGYICWPKKVGALLLLSAPLPYYLSGVPNVKLGSEVVNVSLSRR